ncbi:MAG TPA: SDR family oxidoreductase [Gemmataceae bacterium]|nr:SDR family oxidoreductase [Gemmataceae bacterium]
MHALHDKVILITGASSGIGRASAIRLAGHGARIAAAARSQLTLDEVVGSIRQTGAEALAVPTDVTQAEQCRQAVETTVAHFGRLDALICSAGLSMRTTFEESDLAAMERVIQVNFWGTLYSTYYAIPHVKRARGSLVAISSLTGRRGIPSYALYGASKFAVHGLYESLRLELGRDGVHVGVVFPSFVDTPLRQRVLGPNGQPWTQPPAVPLPMFPVERCVDLIVRLIVKRRPQAVLPWRSSMFLKLEQIFGPWIGDRILSARFPPVS